ncbi:MAG: T9SS type A sorting domain-containing protein [Flavobacteriales bacterium]|nr:T9SS type A sorting domain-containing protein [Flavobacteriales bacterium]
MNQNFKNFLLCLFTILWNMTTQAQLEKVFVEKYYVSDENDATDITGGGVEEGSITYRIYVDMYPGSELVEIFGDAAHPFEIMSTDTFYNNPEGSSFGQEIPKIAYESNTVALDSYLTIGQTGFQGTKKFFGLPKWQDDDGSFIGGLNNDGGSEIIDGGLLTNADPAAGIPLTISDGMDTLNSNIIDWFNFGVYDLMSGEDSSMFGHLVKHTEFVSNNFTLRNSGVQGVIPDSNHVLIAQLTTKGELQFKLNIKIKEVNGTDTTIMTYLGSNLITSDNQIFNPYLIYPQTCGCTDPLYVEYSPLFVCQEDGSCITPHVSGCTDSLACNYDPSATLNVLSLCCYPGFCSDRDIEQVCPQLKGDSFDIAVFPNPAEDQIVLNILAGREYTYDYKVINQHGELMINKNVLPNGLNYNESINLTDFPSGIYNIVVTSNEGSRNKLFVVL